MEGITIAVQLRWNYDIAFTVPAECGQRSRRTPFTSRAAKDRFKRVQTYPAYKELEGQPCRIFSIDYNEFNPSQFKSSSCKYEH